jgi:hypothetical protein
MEALSYTDFGAVVQRSGSAATDLRPLVVGIGRVRQA